MENLVANLVANVDKIHTTPMGLERIKRNLNLQTDNPLEWCKGAIKTADFACIQGKNWYVYGGGNVLTVNAHSFTVITAHRDKVKIRVMEESEYGFLHEFMYNAIYVPDGATPPERDIIFDKENFVYIDNFGKRRGDFAVVAVDYGQIIGVAWTRINPIYENDDDNTPELVISLQKEFRGLGIGTKLMQKIFEMLKERGFSRTSLYVQRDNPALRLYQRLGYKITRETFDHLGNPDYLMIKNL